MKRWTKYLVLKPTHPLQLVLGLTVWAVWFVIWYGGMSVACEVRPPDEAAGAFTWINLTLALISIPITLLLVWWGRCCWLASNSAERPLYRMIARVAAGAHLIAALSTVAMTLPVMVLPPCL